MSLFKRIRRAASRTAKKATHVAVKVSTTGLSHKTQKRIEHAVDTAQKVQGRLAKAATHPSAHNIAKAIPGLSAKKEARLEHTLTVGHRFERTFARASLRPTHKNVHELKAESKIVTRNVARSTAKETVYAIGGITALVSYFFTPVAGAAVGAGLSGASYYVGATAARAKGIHGRAARHAGRVERKKSITAAGIGLTVGVGAIAVGGVVAGSAAAAGVGSGATALVGSGATSTISSVGGLALAAGQKIVPTVISYEQSRKGSSTPSGGISLSMGSGSGSPGSSSQDAPASQGSTTPTPDAKWLGIVLAGVGALALAS